MTTYECSKDKEEDEEDASIWSIQVNAIIGGDEAIETEDEVEAKEDDEEFYEDGDYEEGGKNMGRTMGLCLEAQLRKDVIPIKILSKSQIKYATSIGK